MFKTPEGEPYFHLKAGDHIEVATPRNTKIFLHSDSDLVDHIFTYFTVDEDSEEDVEGMYVFKADNPNFDELIEHIKEDFPIVHADTASEGDKEVLVNRFISTMEGELLALLANE